MTNFHNYAHWKNKQNKKTRLANWPSQPQDSGDSNETQYSDPSGHYSIQVQPSLHSDFEYDTPYDKELMDITGSRSVGAPQGHNGPYLNMTMRRDLVPHAFKMLHHLFNSHTNLMPGKVNEGTEAGLVHHHTQNNQDMHHSLYPAQTTKAYQAATSGQINTPEDLTKHLSHMFANVFLHQLNSADRPVGHPGRDYAIDHGVNDSSADNPENKPKNQYEKDNKTVRDTYQKLLHSYLEHHLKNPNLHTSFASFMDYDKEHAPVFKSFVKDVLAGKFANKGK